MAGAMKVEAVWKGNKLFDSLLGSGHSIVMDASAEYGGSDAGARPLELLLAGVAGCTGMDVANMLEKMRQDVQSYKVQITGQRRDEEPQIFTHLLLEHIVTGNVSAERLARAITLSRDKYCSAMGMFKETSEIESRYVINPGTAEEQTGQVD